MVPGIKGVWALDRLGVRLVFLLGLALLPVGLIAMLQTYRVLDEASSRVDSSLLGESLAASADIRRLITRKVGMAESLAMIAPALLDSPAACIDHMQEVVSQSVDIIFAGVTGMDGVLICASRDTGRTVTTPQAMSALLDTPRSTVTVSNATPITQTAAVLIGQPVFRDGAPVGVLTLTVPYTTIDLGIGNTGGPIRPLDVLTFDADGTPLTSDIGLNSVDNRLPAHRSLSALTIDTGAVFEDTDLLGRHQIYSVVPLVPGQIFALGIWPKESWRIGLRGYAAALAFPMLMWLISLAVAYVAVHRLVIRHIRTLRRNIRTFSAVRRLRTPENLDQIPIELRDVTQAFTNLTEKVLRDEADQENLLHEKDVLLKEVHHRVKNNLQLISSITSMQIRRARHGETKFMLRRLQDRVMGLATVHRSLYQATVLSEVHADELVSDLARQLARSATIPDVNVDFSLKTQPVLLYPDQAVPLSLLVTEAVTNAYKYLGHPETGNPWVSLTLGPQESGQVELLVRNSTGRPVIVHDENQVSGLGSQLIAAFVMQLGGTHTSGPTDDGVFEMRVVFSPAEFTTEPSPQ